MNTIQITQTHAKIGIQTTPSQLNIETKEAQLNMHQEQPQITMQSTKGHLQIDNYEGFAMMGMKNYSDATKEASQRAKQQVMQYISKTASDGTRLAQVEKGGNPIKDIAVRDAWPEKLRQNSYTPVHSPKFNYTQGELKITPPEVKNAAHVGYSAEYIPGDVRYTYTPAKVKTQMRQWPSVEIDIKL